MVIAGGWDGWYGLELGTHGMAIPAPAAGSEKLFLVRGRLGPSLAAGGREGGAAAAQPWRVEALVVVMAVVMAVAPAGPRGVPAPRRASARGRGLHPAREGDTARERKGEEEKERVSARNRSEEQHGAPGDSAGWRRVLVSSSLPQRQEQAELVG